jgi:uncharacterized protein (TIGR03435 family)
MKKLQTSVILAALGAIALAAQTAPPGFETASIKPSDPASTGMQIRASPGGLLTAKNVSLKALILQAYDVRDFQLSGGPPWLDSEKYDIVAKGNGPNVTDEEIMKMSNDQRKTIENQLRGNLQALLTDRFQLKIHREMKDLPAYALVIAKGGSKLRTATEGIGPNTGFTMRRGDAGATEVTGTNTSLTYLIRALSNQLGRPIVDQTGLTANYTFKMSFMPDLSPQQASLGSADPPSPANTPGPSIFTALQEQLGLRLESQKAPVETIVIDAAQKASAN